MNHFERALSDSDQAIKSFMTDIEYLLKITARLHRLGKLSLKSAHMIPHDMLPHNQAIKESDLTRGARVTPELLRKSDGDELDFITAMNNQTSPFGEEKILYGTTEDDDQPSHFDMLIENLDNDSGEHIIKRGDEDQETN